MVYINGDTALPPLIHGGGQERRMRSGTENIYGIAGFAEALDWLVEHREMHHDHTLSLKHHFKQGAVKRGLDIGYNGNGDDLCLSNILSIHVPKTDKTDLILFNLDIYGICASTGSACSSGAEGGSHVIQAIQAPLDRKTLRLSVSHHNTTEDIDYVLDQLEVLLQ